MSELLARMKKTQCCDPAIDGLLGAAIKEIERMYAVVEAAKAVNADAPCLCCGVERCASCRLRIALFEAERADRG